MNDALQHLGPQLVALASQARQAVQADVDDIIQRGDHDTDRIEHQLDLMLGFCYDPDMLVVFKRLCGYYFTIDPVATAGHIHAYREMWDESGVDSGEAGGAGV
jgi:hypothetical protein